MPIDKLVLILVCVIGAAMVTVWLSSLLLVAFEIKMGWLALIPAALVAYVVVRVIGERVGNTEDDHYDKMDH